MEAFKCDACGVFYEKYKDYNSVKIMKNIDGTFYDCKRFDLCPKCSEHIKEFLRIGDKKWK